MDLTFSEFEVSTPDKFDGLKSISQSALSKHKDIESFFFFHIKEKANGFKSTGAKSGAVGE